MRNFTFFAIFFIVLLKELAVLQESSTTPKLRGTAGDRDTNWKNLETYLGSIIVTEDSSDDVFLKEALKKTIISVLKSGDKQFAYMSKNFPFAIWGKRVR